MSEENILSGPTDLVIRNPEASFGTYILDNLKEKGDGQILIDGLTGASITAAELLATSVRVAEVLKARGVTSNDVVGLSSENRFEFTIVSIASLYIGAAVAPVNVTYTPNEIQHVLNISKPKVVFASPLTIKRVLEVTQRNAYVKEVVVFGSKTFPNVTTLDNFIGDPTVPRGDVNSFKATPISNKTHIATILCSSGTTGLPKGVEVSHYSMIYTLETLKNKWTVIEGYTPVMLALLPWFHSLGFVSQITNLFANATTVILPKFEEHLFLKTIQDYKINIITIVPPIMVFLAKHPAVDQYDLSSVMIIGCGAAPLSRELIEEVQKRLPGVIGVYQGYGLTETTLGVLMNSFESNTVGSVGTLATGTQGKVVDTETGRALGPNQKGELCFRGPLLMKGYVNDRKSTNATIDADGWLHTGDIGYYNEDGNWFVVDRLKELIKYKGFQVAPAELEALLLTHTGVKDAAVVGVPDDLAGELPLAFVVRQPNSQVTEQELKSFVAGKVSPAKRLHGGVKFVNDIPKTASGKILRRDLKEQAKKIKSKL